MSYIKFKIISGGIYCKQKKEWKEIQIGNGYIYPSDWKEKKEKEIKFASYSAGDSQKVLELVKDSSIKGLFSYLMGETKRVTEIEKSCESSVKKLNLTLNKLLQSSYYKKTSEPHVTTFFERRDIHKKNIVYDQKVNLKKYNFQTADPTIKLLEKPLKNIMKKEISSLEDIRSLFKENLINKNNETDYELLIKKSKKLEKTIKKIPNNKLKEGIKTALNRVDKKKEISSKVIELIEKIVDLYQTDDSFRKDISNSNRGKFSVFTSLGNTKQWVDKEYHPIVRGAPAYICCLNFDVYISETAFMRNQSSDSFSWEEVVNKLKAGPNLARWGEGGVVFVDYSGLDEIGCPWNKKDKMFIEISSLRQAGLKIKKYDWEVKKESKNKES